ncbi:MAG TPA: NAD(P)-binding domain-containing protein [Jatrophihabitans sp.]|jgi:cation diffusion facilitator CzcD-associated flavoprotein CzcO
MGTDVDIAIVGAGPYGLSAAAHLRAAGRSVRIFGEPLEFWRSQTPIGMWLRSPYHGSNLGDPRSDFTLQAYERETGPITRPIPVERFIDYGLWFQKRIVPDIDRQNVRWVTRTNGGFTVETDSGSITARRVVVAAGVGTFAHLPDELRGLSPELCSHTMSHHDLSHLAHKRVTIVGGGQSALETAALLYESDADVDVLIRAPFVRWLTEASWKHRSRVVSPVLYARPDVGPAFASHLVARPRLYTSMPMSTQLRLATRSVRPAGAGWLRPRLQQVPLRLSTTLVSADEAGDRVKVTLSDGSVDLVDHVVTATGYRVDLSKYRFLDPAVVDAIRCPDGYPRLTAGFETSVAGLHVIGAPAARRHGPLMRFVAGSDFAARAVTRGITGG